MADDGKNVRVKSSNKSPVIYNTGKSGKPGSAGIGEIGNFFIDLGLGTAHPGNVFSKQIEDDNEAERQRRAAELAKMAGFTSVSRAHAQARDHRQAMAERQAAADPQADPTKDFAAYLAQASGMLGGGSDWAGMENTLRSRGAENDAKLQAMYSALQNAIRADAPAIGGIFDSANDEVNKSAQQAVSGIQSGYQQARDAQTAQLAALGIGDAAATLAADGGFAAQAQGDNTHTAEVNRQVSGDALTKRKATALNSNTSRAESAAMGGVESRDALQRSLTDALTQMQMARAQEESQRRQTIFQIASQLQGADQQGQAVDAKQQQALAEFNADLQQQAFENTAKAQAAKRSMLMGLLKQFGGDQQRANEAFDQYQALGLV